MLHHGECVAAFPEGVRGMNKLYRDRYELQRFGLGFMRLALETRTPIVPVGIVGSEEQQPGFANLSGLARLLGMPAFPITLGFPWLGPLGMLPLPVKYRIYFGEPILFDGSADEEDAAIQERVDVVKSEITAMLQRGVAQRSGIFR
jgi:1-acyl-sn-glycerol-3-phosphate acyltransferase